MGELLERQKKEIEEQIDLSEDEKILGKAVVDQYKFDWVKSIDKTKDIIDKAENAPKDLTDKDLDLGLKINRKLRKEMFERIKEQVKIDPNLRPLLDKEIEINKRIVQDDPFIHGKFNDMVKDVVEKLEKDWDSAVEYARNALKKPEEELSDDELELLDQFNT